MSSVLNWCFPDPGVDTAKAAAQELENSQFSSTSAATSRAMNDLFTAFAMILISAFLALLFSFMYLTFLKYCASNLVVVFILILIVGGILMGVGLLQRAKEIKDSGIQEVGAVPLCRCAAVLLWVGSGCLVWCVR